MWFIYSIILSSNNRPILICSVINSSALFTEHFISLGSSSMLHDFSFGLKKMDKKLVSFLKRYLILFNYIKLFFKVFVEKFN
jgi:hypothetical protein